MMRMLHDSGIPVAADELRSFECSFIRHLPYGIALLDAIPSGTAIKVLHPLIMLLPRSLDYKVIWMHRDPKQQARSQRKFLGRPRQWVAPRAKHIREVENVVPKVIERGYPVLRISFDDLVSDPEPVAITLGEWLGIPIDTSSVEVRDPKCTGLYAVGELERVA